VSSISLTSVLMSAMFCPFFGLDPHPIKGEGFLLGKGNRET